MFQFKVGDRFAYVGPVHSEHPTIFGELTEIHADGTMWGKLDSDTPEFLLNGGYRYYGTPEDGYIVPEQIYNSPLYKALL